MCGRLRRAGGDEKTDGRSGTHTYLIDLSWGHDHYGIVRSCGAIIIGSYVVVLGCRSHGASCMQDRGTGAFSISVVGPMHVSVFVWSPCNHRNHPASEAGTGKLIRRVKRHVAYTKKGLAIFGGFSHLPNARYVRSRDRSQAKSSCSGVKVCCVHPLHLRSMASCHPPVRPKMVDWT